MYLNAILSIEKGKLSFGIASNSLTFGDLEFIYVIAAYCVIHRHGEKAPCSESSGNIIVFSHLRITVHIIYTSSACITIYVSCLCISLQPLGSIAEP